MLQDGGSKGKKNRRIRRTISQKSGTKYAVEKINCQGSLFFRRRRRHCKKIEVASLGGGEKRGVIIFIIFRVAFPLHLLPSYLSQLGAKGREEASFSNWREHATGRKGERKEKHEDTYTPLFARERSRYVWKSCCCRC